MTSKSETDPKGKLTLVPTPIGNLGDITLRSLECLKKAHHILAEDTRTTGMLLKHLDIENSLEALHQNNEHKKVPSIVNRILDGAHFAYCSDAGTPGISDPGFLLVRACIEADIEVECLPGATAFIPALVASGLPSDRFYFEGFLPHKKGRQTRIQKIAAQECTTVLYESPHRLLKTLGQLAEFVEGDRRICVCKELTKIHETYIRGSISTIIEDLADMPIKGEFVIVIEGRS